MRFDPQSGFMPESDANAPISGARKVKTPRREKAQHAGLRPSVMIVIVAVTCVLGVWIWREAVYGPQTAAADQMVGYLPDWLKETLHLEDGDEETTVLPVSTPDDAPPGVRSSATVAGPDRDEAVDHVDTDPIADTEPAQPAGQTPRPHLTLGPSDTTDIATDETDDEPQYGLTFQPPFRAKQAYDKGMAKAYYGRHKDAAAQFREAIGIDPEFAQARYQLGLSLLKLENFAGAREQHAALLDLHPQYAAKLAERLP